MNKTLALAACLAMTASVTMAGELMVPAAPVYAAPMMMPVPDATFGGPALGGTQIGPVGPVMGAPVLHGPSVPYTPGAQLFHRVKVEDRRNIAPCAVQKTISVKNPCKRCCTDPDCVQVKICVPGQGCEVVKVRRNGNHVRYDYGKYAVDVRVKGDHIEVDYDD